MNEGTVKGMAMQPGRVIAGVVTRVINAGDARWGKIRLHGFSREVFFTFEDLIRPEEFEDLAPGQDVVFEEQPDRAQGMRATNLRLMRQAG